MCRFRQIDSAPYEGPQTEVDMNKILPSVLGRMIVGNMTGVVGRQFFMERRGDGVPIIRRETQELCGSLPDFRLVDEAELCLIVPAAVLDFTEANAVISVRSSGTPLPNANVLVLFPNRTWKHGVTDSFGEVSVELHTPYTCRWLCSLPLRALPQGLRRTGFPGTGHWLWN